MTGQFGEALSAQVWLRSAQVELTSHHQGVTTQLHPKTSKLPLAVVPDSSMVVKPLYLPANSDFAPTLARRLLSTSLHSIPISRTPSTLSSSHDRRAGSHVPHRLSALLRSVVSRERSNTGRERRAGMWTRGSKSIFDGGDVSSAAFAEPGVGVGRSSTSAESRRRVGVDGAAVG